MSFKTENLEYDDSGLRDAIRQYLDVRKNVNPDAELKKRAINVGYKLLNIYSANGAKKEVIAGTARRVGGKIKVRLKITQLTKANKKGQIKKITRKEMIRREIAARIRAVNFTATGWFPAISKLGGNPKSKLKGNKPKGPERGELKTKTGGVDPWIELINQQPAASIVDEKASGAIQQALDMERDDIMKHVIRKQEEAARKAGL